MRAIWKGMITFGLVNIPIAVFPATREERVSFKQLRKSDLSPIRYKKVAEADEKEVPSSEIVKGYEFEQGRLVTITNEDLEKVQVESTHTIEISDFVDQATINPKFFHTPYFIEAQKGGEKSYALLHRALSETGKVGIAKVAIRSREYLASVKPDGLFLILELMHFADEVLDPDELKPAPVESVTAKELQMAKLLIDSMTTEWDPTRYADQYQTALKELLEAKISKRPLEAKESRQRVPAGTIDLVKILQESLSKAGGGKRTKAAEPAAADPRKRSTSAMVKKKRARGSL
jgi:DNA end-binding protein Ku